MPDTPRQVALLTLLLAACTSGEPAPVTPEHITGVPLIHGADRILNPSAMVLLDGQLVIGDDEAPFLRVFSLDDGGALASAGAAGDGPDEFRMITSLSTDHSGRDGDVLIAFDGRHQQVSPWSMAGNELLPVGPAVRLLDAGSPMRVVADGQGGFVGIGAFADSAFTVHDRDGRLIRRAGSIPFASDVVSPTVAQQVIIPRAAVRASGGRMAIGARHAGRIDLYDLVTGERTAVAAPDPFDPVIRTTDNGAMQIFATDGQTRFGYVNVAASKCCVYGLFSGRTRAGSPGKVSYGQDIHVFDWTGRHLRSITVDQDLIILAVDDDGTVLLGLALDPEPTVWRYDLVP